MLRLLTTAVAAEFSIEISKQENLLVNMDTLDVKLINFGCGNLLYEMVYHTFSGMYYSCSLWLNCSYTIAYTNRAKMNEPDNARY